MSKKNGNTDPIVSRLTAARAELQRVDVELEGLADAKRATELELTQCLMRRDGISPDAILGTDAERKDELRRTNEQVHSLRLTVESFDGVTQRLQAQRAGLIEQVAELQKSEQRAALRELIKQREAIQNDLVALAVPIGSQFVHLSECQQQISALRFNLGEADQDWRAVARPIEQALAFAVMANPSLRFRLDSIEFGQGRAYLRHVMAAEDAATI